MDHMVQMLEQHFSEVFSKCAVTSSASPRKWSGEKPPGLIMHHNLQV